MDYDDSNSRDQNPNITGEGNSKISPVLHSYPLPNFEFDDSLQGHLRFDSLVENDVFLGITSQEDNQWIEDYSRGTSAAESRHKNVWSEATSSESVEMLLKSVGQEDNKVVEETIIEELDAAACDTPGSLTNIMDSDINTLNAIVPNELQENFVESKVSDDCEQPHATFTSQTQETQVSCGELDSVVISDKSSLSFGEKNADRTYKDANQEQSNLASESFVNELQEVPTNSSSSGEEKVDMICDDGNQEESILANESLVSVVQEDPSNSLSFGEEKVDATSEDAKESDLANKSLINEAQEDPSNSFSFGEDKVNAVSDDANQEGSDLANESFVNETQEDSSNSLPVGEKVVDTTCDDGKQEESNFPNESFVNEVQEEGPSNTLSFGEEKVDTIHGDGNQEISNLANESFVNEVQEDPSIALSFDEEKVDTIHDDGNQEESNVENKSFVNEVQEDPSASKVVGGNEGLSQNVNASIEEVKENPQKALEPLVENDGSKDVEMQAIEDTNIMSDVPNSPKPNVQSHSVDETEDVVESDINNVGIGITSIEAIPSAEMPSENISSNNEDENKVPETCTGDSNDEDRSSPVKISDLEQVGDETQLTEPDVVLMDHDDVTCNKREDERLPLDYRDMDMDVVEASDSQKKVELSSFVEGREDVIVIPQESESNMDVLTDAVAAVESSKVSSLDSPDGVQLLSETVDIADNVTEEQPRSPILGVSLLHNDKEEKVQAEESSQKGDITLEVDSALDSPLPVVKNDTVSDDADEAVHGALPMVKNDTVYHDGQCSASPSEQMIENNEGGFKCLKTPETDSLPCNSSAEVGENSEAGGLLDPKESKTGKDEVEPLNLAVNKSDELQASVDVAAPSKPDTNQVLPNESGSPFSDKPEDFSFSDSKSIEPFEVAKDKHEVPTDSILESSSLLKVSNDEKGLQSVSSRSATKAEKSFSFEVSASPSTGPAQTSIQSPSLSKNTNASPVPNKPHEDSLATHQKTPTSAAATEAGAKGTSERKPRRRSAAKETAKKSIPSKDTTPTPTKRSGRVEKSPATGHSTPREELKPNLTTNQKLGAVSPIPTSNLPDPNNSASMFQPSFTDNQQVQLRAQILVYGSLISGMPPEEPHMIAAFGQSDGGRKAWEAAWHACVERVRAHKSQTNNNLSTPVQSKPGIGNKDSTQSRILSTPAAVSINMGSNITSPVVSSMIPISSPLWNISTPGDVSQSTAIPRNPLLDYRQTHSPLHPYQTPQAQNLAPHNPFGLPHAPFPGQWVASSPISGFNARFSSLPITESVKLTTVKETSAPNVSVVPVDHTSGPSVKRATVSSNQPSSDSKSRKRKKVAPNVAASQISTPVPVPSQTHSHNQISFLPQNQTNLVTAPVVTNQSPTSSALSLSTPGFITSKTNSGGFLPPASTHVDQNIEKTVTREEFVSKIEESKVQAADAAVHAAAAVSHCENVWSQMESQRSSRLVSDDEAKLASSAVSIAAAASVAKVAAAAAKIASNVAEQARLMADEVFLSSKTQSHDKATTPASVLKSGDKSENPSSIISAAREAARRRIEAASAASKHAENLDAIVKAAELAAEAVSQAGKIVALGNPLRIKELVEAGPEGYWKTPESSNHQKSNSGKQIVEAEAPGEGVLNDKEIHTLKDSGNLVKNNQIMVIDLTDNNNKSKAKARKAPDSSKTTESEFGSVGTSDVDKNIPQSSSDTLKDNTIKEGCLIEVFKDENKNKAAWFAANVMSLKDGKAFVCYTEIQSDDGSEKLKEWVPLEFEGTEAPKIRIAHPMTTLRFEGNRKRGRTALTDYNWCSGDRVDVWVQDSWREAAVVETNKIDLTSLTVQFPGQGESTVVRSWHVRPTLVWKDNKWIEWSSLKESHSSKGGDTPQEKRQKFSSRVEEDKEKNKSSNNINLAESVKPLPLSAQGSSFEVGKSSKDESKLKTRKPVRGGTQKERSGVVFGVPQPGKKQKFMDVSKHYVANGSKQKNTPNESMPQLPPQRALKSNSRNDAAKEKQVAEVKSKVVKPRKPPIPSTLAQKEKLKSSKRTPHDAASMSEKTVSVDENVLDHQNRNEFRSPSNSEDAIDSTPKETKTSKAVASQRFNKRKLTPGDNDKSNKSTKVEAKDKITPTSEAEPRRSNRKIQPTSRLLEGLQSSLTISKLPTFSHGSQKSHNKVTPKGTSNS